MELVKVENLSKVYGKGETAVKALDNVSFTVNKGEFVAIIGPLGLVSLRSCTCLAGWIVLQVEMC